MAATGFTPIQLYRTATPSTAPTAGNLADGELAINTADGKLFYKDSGGVVQTMASKATGSIGGSTTQVQYNNSGSLAGSSNLTFDGTTLVAANFADSSLTSGRVTYATTSGNLTDSANLTFDGTTLTANALALTTALTVPNGGTGLTSGTSGGVPYFSATNTMASSAALAANALVIGGGAGVAPSTTTTGTGVLTALGNNANATGGFTTINGTATLTNKRIDPRVSSTTSTASLTPDISSFDQYVLTAQAATLAVNAPIGTPVDGNRLIFRILDNGVAQTINWNATYTAIGVTLPTTTTANKTTYVGCIYNTNNTRWDVVAVTTQA
jgi:hypothetical protein